MAGNLGGLRAIGVTLAALMVVLVAAGAFDLLPTAD